MIRESAAARALCEGYGLGLHDATPGLVRALSGNRCARDHLLGDGQNKVGGFAGLTGSVENGAVVGFQNREPIRQIVGMAYLGDDPQMGAKKCADQFGNEFFARVGG